MDGTEQPAQVWEDCEPHRKADVPGTGHTVSRLSDIGGGVLNREGSKPLNYRENFLEFYFRDKYTK